MIGSIAGLFSCIQNDWTDDGTISRTEYFLWMFTSIPPKDLIEPVHPPIAKSAVGVVEKVTPTARMQLLVERAQRRRPAPQVPIHVIGRFFVKAWVFFTAAAESEQAHHPDFTHHP